MRKYQDGYREEEYLNGKLNGNSIKYLRNGRFEIEFTNGRANGTYRKYNERGEIISEVIYANENVQRRIK